MKTPSKQRPVVATRSRVAYENPWLRIREDKTSLLDGNSGIYGVIEVNDSVMTAAVNDKQEVYLIYGYSYPTDSWSWQIPGGGGDHEAAEIAAARELKEETGITASRFKTLASLIVYVGLSTERMSVVLATGLEIGERAYSDDKDSVRGGKFISFSEVDAMIASGEICDSQTLSTLYLVKKELGE